MAKKQRFIEKESYSSGLFAAHNVIIDNETGVNYLFVTTGGSCAITLLVDKDGKPIVTPIDSVDQ